MYAGNLSSRGQGDGGQKFGSKGGNMSKIAASAFLNKAKYEFDENEPEGLGNLLDQRRINEIFVRLKISELLCLFFSMFGVGSGVIDYEISYYDSNETNKNSRIVLEWFCVWSSIKINLLNWGNMEASVEQKQR